MFCEHSRAAAQNDIHRVIFTGNADEQDAGFRTPGRGDAALRALETFVPRRTRPPAALDSAAVGGLESSRAGWD
jgi:hypothetical protein